jgi:hypothetical protein
MTVQAPQFEVSAADVRACEVECLAEEVHEEEPGIDLA